MPDSSAHRVVVVILNFRTAELTIDCLRSLEPELSGLPGWRVIVADNASGDGSAEKIDRAIQACGWSRWASVLALPRNGGYAFGNNQAIRMALAWSPPPEYFHILNPDTVVRPGAVRELARFLNGHPRVGIVGSRLENADGQLEISAHRMPSPWSELDAGARLGLLSRVLSRYNVSPPVRNRPHLCDWVSGSSMMIRRQVFQDIGLMDEGYFLYFDEVDFCCRARRAGWQTWYVPSSCVVHLEGKSTGIRQADRRRPRYWYDSRRRFFVKNYGLPGLIAADALWALGRMSLRLRLALGLGGSLAGDPKCFARDLLLGDCRAILGGEV